MSDLNQCTFIGRLGRDPETRSFPSGDQVTNFSIAVTETWKDKQSGEKMERTEWINIVCTGGLSKVAGEYLRKGSQVMISGKLRTRKWQDKDGQDRYSTEIRADQLQMLGSRQDTDQQSRAPAPAPRQQQRSAPPSDGWDDGSDIPF